MTRAMANSKTLDDILRGLREDVRETCGPEDWEADRITEYLRGLADRIEAAVQRLVREERTEAIDEALAHAEEVRAEKCRNCERASGNAAAMREALKSVAAWLLERFGNPADPDHDKAEGFYILTTGVLAAPPRNCDVGTAEEINARWNAYCAKRIKRENCMSDKNCKGCAWRWAQMPYEDGGGE